MRRRNVTLLFLMLFGFMALVKGQPTDNPMATFYGDSGDYAQWTNEVDWSNTYDMSTYSNGADNFEKFKNAVQEAYDDGGGVLYYPAGEYTFDIPDDINGEGLMLMKGVVIRGEKPSSDKIAISNNDIDNMGDDTDHGLKSMPTRFVFTRNDWNSILDNVNPAGKAKIPKVWNMIGMKKGPNEDNLGEVSHVGVAWIEMEYGYIWFGMGNSDWSDTWGSDASGRYTWLGTQAVTSDAINGYNWQDRVPDGTLPSDLFCGNTNWGGDTALLAEKMFVFGVHMKNALQPNYIINKTQAAEFQIEPNGWRFGGRLGVYGEHLFIANNVIAKPTECFVFDYQHCAIDGDVEGVGEVLFDYGYGIGIDVNKSLATAFYNRCVVNDNDKAKSIFYAEDVIIQDNFIFNNGNKSIEAAGKWLVVKNNIGARDILQYSSHNYPGVPDQYTGVNTSNDQCHREESSDDQMSRFVDLGGWHMWVTGNKWTVTGTNYANDGESLLFQRHNGIETFAVSETFNRQCDGCGGDPGYIAPYDVHVAGLFQGWNVQRGGTGIIKGDHDDGSQYNWAEDVSAPKSINTDHAGFPTSPYGGDATLNQDLLDECPPEVTAADSAINVSVVYDNVNMNTTITYEDNSDNEIAFRIEKQSASLDPETDPWTVITYRPRQETESTATLADHKPAGNLGPEPTDQCYPATHTFNDMNSPMWIDYKANKGGGMRYRVVAIDCDDDDAAASKDILIGDISLRASVAKTAPQMTIKPNPVPQSGSEIAYSLEDNETATVTVMDMQGAVVKVLAEGTASESVSVAGGELAPGTYLVQVMTSNNRGVVDKLIVQ